MEKAPQPLITYLYSQVLKMTEEPEPTITTTGDSQVIQGIQEEVAKQMQSVREEFGNLLAEKDAKIKDLETQNRNLNSSLVRSAILAPPKAEKTEEEVYQEKIDMLSKKTLDIMKRY